MNDDIKELCKIFIRCAKMLIKLLEDFIKEK